MADSKSPGPPMAAATAAARPLLSVREAARFVGLSASAFRAARKRRPCPSYRPTGPDGREHFAEADLLGWLEASRTVPVQPNVEPRTPAPTSRGRKSGDPWAEVLGRKSLDTSDALGKLDDSVLRPEERTG